MFPQTVSSGDPTHGMFAPLFMIGLFFAVALLLRRAAARPSSKPPAPPGHYAAVASLLTPTEARFYAVLAEAVGPMATIQCKVRLADILIAPRHDFSAFRRVSQKHCDFVLCDRATLRPLACVELDDPSHDRPDRIARDAFVDAAYAQARLPLLHIRTTGRYSAPELLRLLQPHLVSSYPDVFHR